MPSTDIAVIKPGGFLALNHEPQELLEAFRVNLGGDRLSLFDLDKATVPGPGGKRWRVTHADGTTSDPEALTGVIVGISNSRAYYVNEYTGGGVAPDCSSYDGGITGVGNPGGTCRDCPLARFGTARNGGAGTACAEIKHLLLLPENTVLPMLVVVPSVSLQFVKGYMSSLANMLIKQHAVVTELVIGTTNTQARKDVVCIKARRVGSLDPAEAQCAEAYRKALDGLIASPTPPAALAGASAGADASATASDVADSTFDPATV